MKRALIHIGPHKTGSTYIQQMMKVNADLFPDTHTAHPKSDPLFGTLQSLTINIHNGADLAERLPAIQDTSTQIARGLSANNTLFSSEDLLGPVPTLAGVSGLYPFLDQTLPAIQSAFLTENIEVQFFCCIREYGDWLRSVHTHKFRGRERPLRRVNSKKEARCRAIGPTSSHDCGLALVQLVWRIKVMKATQHHDVLAAPFSAILVCQTMFWTKWIGSPL